MNGGIHTGGPATLLTGTQHDGAGSCYQALAAGNGYITISKAGLRDAIAELDSRFLQQFVFQAIHFLPIHLAHQAAQLKGEFLAIDAEDKPALKLAELLGELNFCFLFERLVY